MPRLGTVVDRLRHRHIGVCAAGRLAVRANIYSCTYPIFSLSPFWVKPTTNCDDHLANNKWKYWLHYIDAEALQVNFDPAVVTYRQLLEFFYRMHDPTTKDRQGPDMGTQYRSAVFTHGEEQSKIARDITDKVSKEWYKKPVSTQIVEAGQWWDAEEYHQLYLNKNPSGYECPAQYVVLLVILAIGYFGYW